jgi:hypothetical protein
MGAAVEDILTENLGATIKDWFEPSFSKHPFLNINIMTIPESKKQIPQRWAEDVQIDDLFRGDDGDLGMLGGASTWSSEEGRQRLLAALSRLDLPEDHVVHPHLDKMGRNEHSAEKRRVKQELKRYDAEFRKQFGRLPTHTEKEPMRPLYVYYRRLKTMMTQVEQSKMGRNSRTGMIGADGEPRESLTAIADMDETPRTRDSSKGEQALEDQILALEVRIENLQSEKSAVRTKLQTFQEKFVSENNRKIRFHKDILPIEREYRMYKNLKEDIMKAEQQLRDLKSGTGE